MSLGSTLVDESIGRFVVTQKFTDSSATSLNTEEVIPLVPCSQTQYASLFTHLKGYEALYCLNQYDSYKVKGNVQDSQMHSLLIHFQVCKQVAFGELVCDSQLESYLKKRTFRLAMQSTTFDPNYQGDA